MFAVFPFCEKRRGMGDFALQHRVSGKRMRPQRCAVDTSRPFCKILQRDFQDMAFMKAGPEKRAVTEESPWDRFGLPGTTVR